MLRRRELLARPPYPVGTFRSSRSNRRRSLLIQIQEAVGREEAPNEPSLSWADIPKSFWRIQLWEMKAVAVFWVALCLQVENEHGGGKIRQRLQEEEEFLGLEDVGAEDWSDLHRIHTGSTLEVH